MDKNLPHAHRVGATSTPEERRKVGLSMRQRVPRSAQAEWTAPANRADPVAILIEQGKNRIQELLPVRYARMKADPFAFLRGAAAVMAIDLEKTPSAGIRLQACGDAHLANFGTYATPEGTPVFDINDFDETLPAPFEWDVKRLAASLAVAGRVAQSSKKECMALACTAARAYREHMSELAPLPPLVAWSRCIDLAEAIADIDSAELRDKLKGRLAKVVQSGAKQFGLVVEQNGAFRIREKLPLVRHLDKHELRAREALSSYAGTLQEDRRVLLQRYALHDVAFKAVGVGSVGTFCAIALLVSGGGAPLLLQIKEAQQSVLAPSAGASEYANHGQRGRDRRNPGMDAKADPRPTFLRATAQGLAACRHWHETGSGIALLCRAVRTHACAGSCTGRRCGRDSRLHGQRDRVRRGDRRVCDDLCRPDRPRLERLPDRD